MMDPRPDDWVTEWWLPPIPIRAQGPAAVADDAPARRPRGGVEGRQELAHRPAARDWDVVRDVGVGDREDFRIEAVRSARDDQPR